MKKVLYLFSLIYFFTSCVEKNTEGIGKKVVPVPAGFAITENLTATAADVDFMVDSVDFTAKFNSTVTAVVTIVGQESGAVRVFEKVGSEITAEDFRWYGEFQNNTYRFFQKGEIAVATMSFYGTNLTESVSITVTEVNDFSRSESVELMDPTAGGENGYERDVLYPWWLDVNTDNGISVGRTEEEDAVEGNHVLTMTGRATGGGVYIAGASMGTFNLGPYNSFTQPYYDLPNAPDDVWVNYWVKGDGNTVTDLYIIFHELDSIRSNGTISDDFDYSTTGIDDGMSIRQKFDHEGWKMVSLRYSSIAPATYCAGSDGWGCGNKIHEPHRIKVVSFNLQAEKQNEQVTAKLDYLMFTVGGPFNPEIHRK